MSKTVFDLEIFKAFFDCVSAVFIGVGESSDGFDANGLIQAIAVEFFQAPQGVWYLDFTEILSVITALGSRWDQWTLTCPLRVHSWLTSLQEVFGHHSRELTQTDLGLFAAKYSLAALADLGEDFLKYQTNFVACKLFLQDEYPVRPLSLPEGEKDGFLFPSQHRWLFHRLRNAKERLRVGYNLIQFKRGCQPVSTIKRLKALAKHAKALGRLGKDKDELAPWIEQVKRAVSETLGAPRRGELERLLPPSTSSHHGYSRAEYGALPPLQNLGRPFATCENHTELTFSIFDCDCHHWLIADTEASPDLPEKGLARSACHYAALSYAVNLQERVNPIPEAKTVSFVCPKPAEDLKSQVFMQSLFSSKEEDSKCDVHTVLEPFKVRTITAGSATLGWIGRFWQQKIHKKVGEHPVFEWTHAPCSFQSIRATFGSVPPENVLVSGDYEAATDNIEVELTKAAWEACAYWLEDDPAEREVVVQVGHAMLSGQNLQYATSIKRILKDAGISAAQKDNTQVLEYIVEQLKLQGIDLCLEQEQIQGQLMGCILSFFLLCMINAATCRSAFEQHYGRAFSLREVPMRINGDDILFHAVPEVVEIWKVNALTCGLKPSLGKNFVSREFAMINSEMYRFEKRSPKFFTKPYLVPDQGHWVSKLERKRRELCTLSQVVWAQSPLGGLQPSWKGEYLVEGGYGILPSYLEPTKFLPYLNLGLLTGVGRVQEDSRVTSKFIFGDGGRTESVGARARALVKGFSKTQSKRIIERFVAVNRDVLQSTTRGWGIPEDLGGLGIPFIDNHSVEGLVVAAFLDQADPALYKSEIQRIKGVCLAPPPHVVDALDVQTKVLKSVAVKRWGTEEESRKTQLPLLVGATWLGCDLEQDGSSRCVGNAEAAYRHLVRRSVNSGVRAMTRERLQALEGKVIVYDFDLSIISQMRDWVPLIDHRLVPKGDELRWLL